MVNYQNTKIYKIESHLGSKIYIGSTTKQYLSQRMDSHRGGYKQWKKDECKYMTSFDLFDEYGLENCKIILIEAYPCNIHDERAAREGYNIKTLECVNKMIPGRTSKEYYEDNKDKTKEYYINNKEIIKDYAKIYRDNHKDLIKESKHKYREDNKEQINEQRKQYRINNKEKIKEASKIYTDNNKEKMKQYREENKDKIKEYKSKIITCSCGKSIHLYKKSEHEKTKFHIKYLGIQK